MPDPATFRDSTQIVIPRDSLEEVRDAVESEFTVTVSCGENGTCRIIGSPVVIKDVSRLLARHGVPVE